jgi:hypothetical protein
MKKFLKLIAENQPGAQDEFTVTLTDPVGEVVNQFTITGGDFAFDNFQEFKEEMTGVVEDQESDIDVAQIATKDNEDIEKAKDELNKKLVQSMNKLTSQIK